MIQLNELIKSQLFEVLVMFYAGIAVMILWEIFSWIRGKTKMKAFAGAAFELLFWIFAALLAGAFLYFASFGQMSVHAFCAAAFGAFLWKKIFYGIIDAGDSKCSKENPAEAANGTRTTR